MNKTPLHRINSLRSMTVRELQAEWLKLYGEPTRSRNRDFLFRRLAWRIQELQHGGLSDRAKAKIDELANGDFRRARTPSRAPAGPEAPLPKVRDIRKPVAGSVITKAYKGRPLRVVVREDGFELDGQMYGSLTAAAKAITGSKSINGKLFFGLTRRRR